MPTYRINEIALRNTARDLQARNQGDKMHVILAVIDRKTRPIEAKLGELKGQLVEKVTIRPILSAGWDGLHNRPVYSVIGIHGPVLAADEWLSSKWLDDIQRRTKAILPDGMPPPVRSFLLEGNGAESAYATPRVYRWLAAFYAKLSLTEGDAAAKESARLLALAEPVAPVADERAEAIEKIKKVWLRGPVRYDLGRWLVRRFGVNQLEMLSDQNVRQIAAAIR